jgi:hypothetical protein
VDRGDRRPRLHLQEHLAGQVVHGSDDVGVVTGQERYLPLVKDDPHLSHGHTVAPLVAVLASSGRGCRLERIRERRGPDSDRMIVAELTGEAQRHARWEPRDDDAAAAAAAELREIAAMLDAGRADTYAQRAIPVSEPSQDPCT